jgi:predicted RND superfamily exporter protein
MSKKYIIKNSNTNLNTISDNECTVLYFLYIVLFFVIIIIIYKFLYCYENNNETETFKNNNNKELSQIKKSLQNKLKEQTQAIYISENYNKVESSSLNDELKNLLIDFADTKLPAINMDNKKIINNQIELNSILTEVKGMKNIYKPGDIVNSNSTFNISKDDICYRHNNKAIKPTTDFVSKYPNCMVCAIENDEINNNLKKTQSWINTKTNISKVCLYDPKAKPNSGIPNLKQCKTFCNINNK